MPEALALRGTDAKEFPIRQANDVSGGFGIFTKAGLERLFRDARLGRIQPTNPFPTREIVPRRRSASASTRRRAGG